MTVTRPKVIVECAGVQVASLPIKNINQNANFSDPVQFAEVVCTSSAGYRTHVTADVAGQRNVSYNQKAITRGRTELFSSILADWKIRSFCYLGLCTLMAASCAKRNVTVHPSVCMCLLYSNLNRARGAYSTWVTRGSTRRGQRTFPSEYYEDGHTCLFLAVADGRPFCSFWALISSCDHELWYVTLTFDLNSVKVNQRAKYLGQKSLLGHKDTHRTDYSTWAVTNRHFTVTCGSSEVWSSRLLQGN